MRIINFDEVDVRNLRNGKLNPDRIHDAVKPILRDVRRNGDKALIRYTKKFDNYNLTADKIRVSREEIKDAYKNVDKDLIRALKHAHKNITKFHREQFRQIKKSFRVKIQGGVFLSEKTTPLASVGAYIPGGIASYPSTVLMTCIPAGIAGVERIAIASPPPVSDPVLAAAYICKVDEIYRIGGAQAIGALAYGTGTIRPVDKIAGPGNVYVTAAKMRVYGIVDIDMPAGPSEILIIADETANPEFIAADILAQAEHDPNAGCAVVTNDMKLANQIKGEINVQIKDRIKRIETIKESLKNFSMIITKSISRSIEFANNYAPEHLEIMTRNPESVERKIRHAGAIFIGKYSTVSAGDYASGGNHVLPTAGSARFSSGLSVREFLKTSGIQKISRSGLMDLKKTIIDISTAEGLYAHGNSVRIRLK